MAATWWDDTRTTKKEWEGQKMRVMYITSVDEIWTIQETLMEGGIKNGKFNRRKTDTAH